MKDADQDFRLNRIRNMYKSVSDLKGYFKKKELKIKKQITLNSKV